MNEEQKNKIIEIMMLMESTKMDAGAAVYCHRFGINSVTELSEKNGVITSTLNNWYHAEKRQKVFKALVLSCAINKVFGD